MVLLELRYVASPPVGEELVSSRGERTGVSGGDELLPYGVTSSSWSSTQDDWFGAQDTLFAALRVPGLLS